MLGYYRIPARRRVDLLPLISGSRGPPSGNQATAWTIITGGRPVTLTGLLRLEVTTLTGPSYLLPLFLKLCFRMLMFLSLDIGCNCPNSTEQIRNCGRGGARSISSAATLQRHSRLRRVPPCLWGQQQLGWRRICSSFHSLPGLNFRQQCSPVSVAINTPFWYVGCSIYLRRQ